MSTRTAATAVATPLSYANKNMLAPMVRVGTLPSRLLALKYGADVVYGEELIDHKMVNCRRVVNPVLETVDFVGKNGAVVFRTCAEERKNVVFQMGTSDPGRAVRTAQLVCADVAGIDVNMGCPKSFSLKGGMGAALLEKPEKVTAILTALVQQVPAPITCKIRLLPTYAATLSLVKAIEATGVRAIGIHGRLTAQRSRVPISPEQAKMIRDIASNISIPVIANGGSLDIECYDDIAKFKELTGSSSVMIARSAQWNMSVYRREGLLSVPEVAKDYMRLAMKWDNSYGNTKFCLMSTYRKEKETLFGKRMLAASTMRALAELWDLEKEFDAQAAAIRQRSAELNFDMAMVDDQVDEVAGTVLASLAQASSSEGNDGEPSAKRVAVAVEYISGKYRRKDFRGNVRTPKTVLYEHCMREGCGTPVCVTEERPADRQFRAVCQALGVNVCTKEWHGNKKQAEQASCLALLRLKSVAEPSEWPAV